MSTTAPASMAATGLGPCGWDVDWSCCDNDVDDVDPATLDLAATAAAELLWRRTGRVYGLCPVTVRPCRDDCTAAGGTWTPHRIDGAWVNVAGCGCRGSCGCGAMPAQVTLPGPVADVVEVLVDGVALDPAAYRVDSWRYVVRQDGGRWPACVHLGDPAPGGWQITYNRGRPVPPGGLLAVSVLACELVAACTGRPCRLPRAATQVSRQGVTVALADLGTLTDQGRFGLYEVDQWVSSVQPDVVASGMLAPLTPDLPAVRFQTWPPQ